MLVIWNLYENMHALLALVDCIPGLSCVFNSYHRVRTSYCVLYHSLC